VVAFQKPKKMLTAWPSWLGRWCVYSYCTVQIPRPPSKPSLQYEGVGTVKIEQEMNESESDAIPARLCPVARMLACMHVEQALRSPRKETPN
jgi:hypothetical protein